MSNGQNCQPANLMTGMGGTARPGLLRASLAGMLQVDLPIVSREVLRKEIG